MRKPNHTINLDKPLSLEKRELLEIICIQRLYIFFPEDKALYRNKSNKYLMKVSREVLLFLIANTNDSLYIEVTAKEIQTSLGISVHYCKRVLNVLQHIEIVKRVGKRGFIYHENLMWNFKNN